jgi:uncharacterized protein
VLLARRQALLDEVAASIEAATGARARAVAVDLAADDAMDRVLAATAGLEVGFVAYCAGADANYAPFLDHPVETALAMVQRNCELPVRMCHHFAAPMVARGHGGIVLVGSGAGLVGAPNMVAYAASKAFDMVFGEALWAELHPQGVDVLSLILGQTDTPALRTLLARRGVLANPDDPVPIPGTVTAAQVVQEALGNLANGPTWFVGEQLRDGARRLGAMDRGDAVRVMTRQGAATMGANT